MPHRSRLFIPRRNDFMAKRVLEKKRIAVLAADGFEKVELTIPMKALKLAGAKVDVISLREGSIRGVNLHEPASRVEVTKTVAQANPELDAALDELLAVAEPAAGSDLYGGVPGCADRENAARRAG